MPKKPMRSLIDRAIEKSEHITDFTALPMLFQTKGEGRATLKGPDKVYAPVLDFSTEKVVAVWHTPDAVEIVLSNGMRFSIEISPLTMAMRIYPDSQAADDSVALLILIRDDENLKSTAQLVERRIRALRQLYAIGVITQDAERYAPRLRDVQIKAPFDYEDILEPNEKLILRSAGEGTWWTVVQKVGAFTAKAPKATLVILTTVLKGGVARTEKYVDAHVQSTQAIADKNSAEAEGVQIQNQIARQAALEAPARTKIETTRQQIALSKEQNELNRAEFAEQKEKADAFREYVDWLENIKDPEIKEKVKAELMQSSRDLIGPVAEEWLKLSPPKS
jgi:hypothetical protein